MTKLSFEAPSDLSVGRVRIADASGVVTEWIATPDDRRRDIGNVPPGFYTAEISPAGVPPQSVVFEVRPGAESKITVPAFSWLQANTGNVTFLEIRDEVQALEALYPGTWTAPLKVPDDDVEGRESAVSDASGAVTASLLAAAAFQEQRLSVGLSIEGADKADSFRPYLGQALLEIADGRLELTVENPETSPYDHRRRVRLTVAIERNRVERLLLPMYRGGVQVTLWPSALSHLDVALEVTPSDPRLRALARVLLAGAAEEAVAISPLLTHLRNLSEAIQSDPWEAMLCALLSVRFPDALPPPSRRLVDLLMSSAPWAYDVYVIGARQRLHGAEPGEDRLAATLDALELLRKAQTRGSPYFAYTNRLFAELIEALSGYFDRNGPTQAQKNAAKIRARWFREQALQTSAGASFSWLRRDPESEKAGFLEPYRNPSGTLPAHTTNVIFSGRLTADRIRIESSPKSASEVDSTDTSHGWTQLHGDAPRDAPALARPPGAAYDPNRGRFGSQSAIGGYSLNANFESDHPERATIRLTVVADEGVSPPAGAVAWFCLHPTFRPHWVRVMLTNGRGEMFVESSGGFTVGVWLPNAKVELELDLAKHPDAPETAQRY